MMEFSIEKKNFQFLWHLRVDGVLHGRRKVYNSSRGNEDCLLTLQCIYMFSIFRAFGREFV